MPKQLIHVCIRFPNEPLIQITSGDVNRISSDNPEEYILK